VFSIADQPSRHSTSRRRRTRRTRITRAASPRHRDRKRRRRQLHKARQVRRKLQRLHRSIPTPARSLFDRLSPAFSRPTFLRCVVLALATILTVGHRTVCNVLRTLGALIPGNPSSYHRVFSKRRWSAWRLAHGLAGWVFDYLVPDGRVVLAGDDTVDEHRGANVFAKARHRDAVRSSHTYTAFRWGHKWVVLAVLVRFPFTRRQWALPLLVALYRSAADDAKAGRRHKTPAQLLYQLTYVLLRWFRQRRFVLTADGNFATHEVARAACRRGDRLTLVSPFYADANLYEPPPAYSGCGRPRVKGAKLPLPQEVVAGAVRTALHVAWYGGGERDVEVVSGVGQWYKSGRGLVAVRWVWVHDVTGTHRDSYFCSTDVTLSAAEIIALYTGRWNLETTFQEMRAYLGLETTRGWTAPTVQRVAPCLFGLYTVVAGLYRVMPQRYRRQWLIAWHGKQDTTFADALSAVRRWLWQAWVFAIPGHNTAFAKLTRPFRTLLLNALAPAG
jgi:hypothetical protein